MQKPEYAVQMKLVAFPADITQPPIMEPDKNRPATLADLRVLEARIIAEIKELFA